MKMTLLEFQRITAYLMEELVENTERDWDTKHEILCEELVNSFDIELVDKNRGGNMNSDDRFNLMNDRDDWQKEIDKAYQRINEINDELDQEYKDGETCWAANLEAEKEELEETICDLEKRIEDYNVAISETNN